MKTTQNLFEVSNYNNYSFAAEFQQIISDKLSGYDGNEKTQLRAFLDDLFRGGCASGIIGDFVYNSDCKEFYIRHIDDLEDMKSEIENAIGEPLRTTFTHYVFIVWLCFEEYCTDLENQIFYN